MIINEYDDEKFGIKIIKDYKDYQKDIEYICYSEDEQHITENDVENIFRKTSYEVPFTYEKDLFLGNMMYINRDYFKKNKEEVIKIISNIMKNTQKNSITITEPEFIVDDVISAIKENRSIEKVTIVPYKDYALSAEYLQAILENPSIKKVKVKEVEESIRYQYNERLDARNQKNICGVSLNDIVCENTFIPPYWTIDRVYSDDEIESFKKLIEQNPIKNIKIIAKEKSQLEELLPILKGTKISIRATRDFSIEQYGMLEKQENVSLESGGNVFTPTQCKNREKILDLIIEEVKEKDLSPLEQYMYLYNITKLFKDYKDNKNDPHQARTSEYTLNNNDYMVCVGYASLLDELVKRLNNPNIHTSMLSCTVDEEGHERILAHITDEKYGIDGCYSSDPTWDHVNYYGHSMVNGKKVYDYNNVQATIDKYTHMLLTKEEVNMDGHNYTLNATDILFSENIDQAIEQITKSDTYYIKTSVIDHFKELYPNIEITEDNLIECIQQIKQPNVSGDILKECITNLYHEIYKDMPIEKQEQLIQKTIGANQAYQELCFPENKEKFGKVA